MSYKPAGKDDGIFRSLPKRLFWTFMVQMENVEGEAEQQPFSSNLHIAPKQKTPEIKILLHIRKVALGLNGTVHPKQTSLGRGDLCFHSLPLSGKAFLTHR